jgi:hypothetical protein
MKEWFSGVDGDQLDVSKISKWGKNNIILDINRDGKSANSSKYVLFESI